MLLTVLRRRDDVISGQVNGETLITTKAVLAEEHAMLTFARNGRGQYHALGNGDFQFQVEFLNREQRNAVQHVLSSKDRVVGSHSSRRNLRALTVREEIPISRLLSYI